MACVWFPLGQAGGAPLLAHHTEHHLLPGLWDVISQIQADWGLGHESDFLGRGGALGRGSGTWFFSCCCCWPASHFSYCLLMPLYVWPVLSTRNPKGPNLVSRP